MITCSDLGHRGRLGNQLYQYAFLRAAAERTGLEVAIPARCTRWTGRRADLGAEGLAGFRIEAATYEGDAPAGLRRRVEPEYATFDPELLRPEDGTDFSGFFQSLAYFADAEARLRREFRFLPAIEDRASSLMANWRAEARGRPIVAVTVRRGDYLDWNGFRFRVLDAPEVLAALDEFPDALVALGSDDLDWCHRHLHLPSDRVREIPQDCTWTALAIAASCDHHVISASTFSWWGAWLAPRPGRVLYPDPWFLEPELEAGITPNRRHPPSWEPLPTDRHCRIGP